MPSTRPPVRFTYAEYRTLPEGSRHQLIEGDLIVSPAPTRRHQNIVMRIAAALYNFIEARGLGEVLASPPDVIFSDEDVSQPDIVYVSKARTSILVAEGIRGGPDLCIEVLSERTQALDRGAKRVLYARHGVTEYWIVDPEADTLEVYRLQENAKDTVRAFGMADTLMTGLLPGFSLPLAGVFAR